MRFYNTLTREVEEFKPITPEEVKLYACGPTVYSFYHIGNLRNAVFNDTLRRSLEMSGYRVNQVMNITDVGHLVSDGDEGEDKLQKGAKAEGKSVWEVAHQYTQAFKDDMKMLNVLPPNGYSSPKYRDSYARATEFIDQQIAIIKALIDKHFAYQTKQAIYFDVTKLGDYGKLTGQKLSDKEVAARREVVTDKNKRSPQDFGLWFLTVGRFAGHDMHWPSPWGDGFPGWHLECSAIIHATLGDPIDIHTGAVDLIGTHHTNEMAQTKAAFGHKLANYWIHNEYLLVDGQKMSKSLKNDYTLRDITGKKYDPLALRLLCLQSHYRSQMNFSWEALEGAQVFLNRLRVWADLVFQPSLGHKKDVGSKYPAAMASIKQALDHDLNTPKALAVLSDLSAEAERSGVDIDELKPLLKELDKLFGLSLSGRSDIDELAKKLIAVREEARTNGDWAKADKLRVKLAQQGIDLNDTPHGAVWSQRA